VSGMRPFRAALLSLGVAASAAAETRVALPPVAALTDGARADAGAVEEILAAAVAEIGEHRVITPDRVRELLRRQRRRDLEACEGALPCLAELGRLAGAHVVLYGEAGALAGGRVVYLKAVDVESGAERGSTAVVLEKGAAAGEARAAAVRLLAPERYTGVLEVQVDVRGASVFVDGVARGQSPLPPLALPVGTHALRVTHESYRDFVRFVDVGFGGRTRVAAELQKYPVVGRALQAGGDGGGALDSPWVLAGAGVAVAVVVTVIVALIPRGVERDRDVTVNDP
jgi:hypothetical protein